MIDHIFTLSQLLERAREYKLPLCIAFVDYEKAFDSAEFNAILKALVEQGINAQYINLLKEANTGCTTGITLLGTPHRIPIEKGVKQGDMISPKLFTACFEMVMNKINWRSGVNINGERLSHLRFTDDIVLITESTNQLQSLLRRLDKKSSQVGLKMNHCKTKYMRSDVIQKTRITITGEEIEEVEQYIYLGQEVNVCQDLNRELSQRIRAGWCAFISIKDILKGKIDKTTRTNIFNSTVLPAMLYGSKTWALTKREEQRLLVAERAMERAMLGISLLDRILNEMIRERSGVKDIIVESRHNYC
uniref:Reverse transcriptase domain-containing protein n=1 Tax=Pelodiscus sinensis TaxID=13735 RepID=K7F154_PELSI